MEQIKSKFAYKMSNGSTLKLYRKYKKRSYINLYVKTHGIF